MQFINSRLQAMAISINKYVFGLYITLLVSFVIIVDIFINCLHPSIP